MMTEIKTSSQPWYKNDLALLAGLALIKLLLHLPILTQYGYHHDELYFIACGQNLSFGYVDHAPLVPWIAGCLPRCSVSHSSDCVFFPL